MSSNEASSRAFFQRIAVYEILGRAVLEWWFGGCRRTTRALQRDGRGGGRVDCSVSLDSFCVAGSRGLGKGDGGGGIFEWREGVARELYRSLKYMKCELTISTICSGSEEE